MRMTLGELVWKITGDNANFDKSMSQTDKKLGKTKKSFLSFSTVIKGAVVAAIGLMGKKLIGLASDAEETSNKFAVTFGEISDKADQVAKDLADSYGLSSLASKRLLSDTGDLLTGFGFTQDASLDLANEVNKLAVDLASFTNFSGGAEGASAALTKALLGERESVKSLGISILEADVKAKVLENTQKGMTFESNRQAKAFATLQIAQEQSKNAIGDFARSEASFANQTRIASANIEDQGVALGNALLPYANLAVTTFNKLSESSGGVIDKFVAFTQKGETIAAIIGAVEVAAGFLRIAFEIVAKYVKNLWSGIGSLSGSFDKLKDALGDSESAFGAFDVIMAAASISGKAAGAVIGAMVKQLINLAVVIIEAGQLVGSFIKGLAGRGFGDFKRNLGESKAAILDLAQGAKDGFLDIAETIGVAAAVAVEDFGEASEDLKEKLDEQNAAIKANVEDAITGVGELESEEDKARKRKAAAEAKERKDKVKKDKETNDKILKDAKDAAKEAKDALESLTPGGLIAFNMFGTDEEKSNLTQEIADQYNKLSEEEEEAKKALESLTPGGLIAFSMFGTEEQKDGLTQEIVDQYNAHAEILGDMFGQMGTMIDDYYSNQISDIDAATDRQADALDAELQDKISQLDKAALGEEEYNRQVEAFTNETENKKAMIERQAAQKTYELELKAFRTRQKFALADIAINTAAGMMKVIGQTGIFGFALAPFVAALGIMQAAAVLMQKPPAAPAYANGGIVPARAGVPATGDNMMARVNPGELILNEAQQGVIAGKMSSTVNITVITPDKRTLYKGIHDASKRGEVLIDTRAVI